MSIFQPDRYLLKKQIKKYSHYLKGVILDAGSGEAERYKFFFNFDKYLKLDIDSSGHPDIVGSVENISLEDSSVDSIISAQLLEHVANPSKALAEFYRVLKPGGHCLVTVPQLSELHEEPRDFFRFTRFGLEEIFRRAGFEIVVIEERGGFWIANAQMRIRYIIDLFRLNKIRVLRWIFRPFIWFNGVLALFVDKIDKSQASKKHALGWLVVAKK